MNQPITDEEANALVEEFLSWPADMTAADYLEQMDGDDEWFIDGLVCTSLTFFYGKPEAGKSTLAVNIAASLSKGESVLGIEPRTGSRPLSVVIVGSEANIRQEYPQRLQRLGADLNRIGIDYIGGSGEIHPNTFARAEYGAVDLVIVDNLQGLTDGRDTNDSSTAKHVQDKIQPFLDEEVPVIVIHHASSAHRDNERGNRMQGNTQLEAMSRWRVEVQKVNGTRRRLIRQGNLGKRDPLQVEVDDDLRMSLVGEAPENKETKPKRSDVTRERRSKVWEAALRSSGATTAAVAREIEETTGQKFNTVKKDLEIGVDSKVLVKREGQIPLYASREGDISQYRPYRCRCFRWSEARYFDTIPPYRSPTLICIRRGTSSPSLFGVVRINGPASAVLDPNQDGELKSRR